MRQWGTAVTAGLARARLWDLVPPRALVRPSGGTELCRPRPRPPARHTITRCRATAGSHCIPAAHLHTAAAVAALTAEYRCSGRTAVTLGIDFKNCQQCQSKL